MIDYKNMQWGGSGMTYEAWKWIRDNIKKGSTIVEFGAGAISTPRLAPFYNVISFEHAKPWADKVNKTLTDSDNPYMSTVHHAPLKNMFYDKEVIDKFIPTNPALIILDGPTYSATSSREPFVKLYGELFYPSSCPLLVDDLHRSHDLAIANILSSEYSLTVQLLGPKNHMFGVLDPNG